MTSFIIHMNKNAIIVIFIGTVIVIGDLIWLGRPAEQSTGGQANITESILKSSETIFNFGTISMANGNVSHEFRVTNGYAQPINISKIYTSCMCTAANFKFNQKTFGPFGMEGMGGITSANITLSPGESGSIEVVYDPNAHGPAGVGAIDRFIYVEDKNGGQLKLEIKAAVTP